MKSFEQLARAAYSAYLKVCQEADEEGLAGHALTYDELDEVSKSAWRSAAMGVVAEVSTVR